MNEYELSQNKQLDSYDVRDLNVNPAFPYPDSSFDVVTCVVSIDYLNQPDKIFAEIGRVLRPNGKVIISMSNRCAHNNAVHEHHCT
jgi:ubiquinone/menaquinone biosynthesis C-methylase UbiE